MLYNYKEVFDELLSYYGEQKWWPADSLFEVVIGAILVQNTNWNNVEKAINQLKPHLNPWLILQMSHDELANLIRASGFYNLKAKRIKAFLKWFQQYNFSFSELNKIETATLRTELLNVYGIGPETGDVILLYTLERPVFIADAYALRIFNRLGLTTAKRYEHLKTEVESSNSFNTEQYNELHALIIAHAKKYCKTKPNCDECPLTKNCLKRFDNK